MTGVVSRCVLLLLIAAILGWLAHDVAGRQTMELDTHIREAVHANAIPPLTRAMLVLSMIGEPFVVWTLAALVFFGFWRAGFKDSAVVFAIAMWGAVAIEQILKFAIRRPRPHAYFDYPLPASYSFPSGHAALSLAMFGTLAALLSPKLKPMWSKALLWVGATVMIAGIGFSRIYLGVHYPTDVMAGYLASLFWLLAVELGNYVRQRRVKGS